jgi:hypothetical protein
MYKEVESRNETETKTKKHKRYSGSSPKSCPWVPEIPFYGSNKCPFILKCKAELRYKDM